MIAKADTELESAAESMTGLYASSAASVKTTASIRKGSNEKSTPSPLRLLLSVRFLRNTVLIPMKHYPILPKIRTVPVYYPCTIPDRYISRKTSHTHLYVRLT